MSATKSVLRERVVDVGVPLVVREWGEAGAPLVYWPGLNPFGALALNEAGPVWAEKYALRVISISPPGLETPPLPPVEYRLSRLAALVVRLLDALGLERVAFAGYSWGASLGCHLAAGFPERLSALVLLDAGYQDIPDDGTELETRIDEARAANAEFAFPGWDAFLAAAREGRPRWSAALEERLCAGMREEGAHIVAAASPDAAAAAIHGVVAEPPTRQLAALGKLDLRVLLLVSSERGDTDEGRAAVERFRAEVPKAVVERIADSGHDLLADQPETTIHSVGSFLSRAGSTA